VLHCFDQVIALNSSNAAEGELYVDDGKSYDYQQGAFIHRRFVFADNKLTSLNMAPDNLGKKKFTSECVIERIIILGLRSGAK
jgi:alpha 1,3-glucosidase